MMAAPRPAMVPVIIFAAVIAAEAPIISIASPGALIALEILRRVRAAMMLGESVAGISAGAAVIAVAGALRTGDAAGKGNESKRQK